MHYLKCYTFLFLIIPTLFLAGLSNSVSFGATDKPQIITPSKIICCKDDTSTSSDSASTSLASPLKKISTLMRKKLSLPQKSFVARMILVPVQILLQLLLQAH